MPGNSSILGTSSLKLRLDFLALLPPRIAPKNRPGFPISDRPRGVGIKRTAISMIKASSGQIPTVSKSALFLLAGAWSADIRLAQGKSLRIKPLVLLELRAKPSARWGPCSLYIAGSCSPSERREAGG